METQVPCQMTDKWTMGSGNEGLYNGTNPLQEKEEEKEKESDHETTTVAPRKHNLKEFIPRI